jgi:succinylarginine dihydrolase
MSHEVNFDGIVGPTHHYGGLSFGNVASERHRHQVSHPRQAALQGLEKMKLLADLGVKQAVLPPHPRPCIDFLRRHGFSGTDAGIVVEAARSRPDLLSIAYSAASMWAANMATVSPSADTADGRVHLTPANLVSTPHRALEAEHSTRVLKAIFADPSRFVVHDPLPFAPEAACPLTDEGAANHTRLCPTHADPGIELFVYGRNDADQHAPRPVRYPARQSRAASAEIARRHRLDPERTLIVQQNPEAIDAGVFHNDVISVGNENMLLSHSLAFCEQQEILDALRRRLPGLHLLEVSEEELTLSEAVESYLFNSQLLTLPQGGMLLLCPSECDGRRQPGEITGRGEEGQRGRGEEERSDETSQVSSRPSAAGRAGAVLDRLLREENPITEVRFVDIRESMRNGGGPACLRLRVVLTHEELASLSPSLFLTDSLYEQIRDWINGHYREELTLADLGDPAFIDEVRDALDELHGILGLSGLP